MNMFKEIENGFVDIYGVEWSESQIMHYNKISKEIFDREQTGYPVSEQMRNERHVLYNLPRCTEMLIGKKKGF